MVFNCISHFYSQLQHKNNSITFFQHFQAHIEPVDIHAKFTPLFPLIHALSNLKTYFLNDPRTEWCIKFLNNENVSSFYVKNYCKCLNSV